MVVALRFAGGTGNGIYIVDATDPAHPVEIPHVATGALGNFRVGPAYAAGNYVSPREWIRGHRFRSSMSAIRRRRLLSTGAAPDEMYSAVVIGDRVFGTGANGNYSS